MKGLAYSDLTPVFTEHSAELAFRLHLIFTSW